MDQSGQAVFNHQSAHSIFVIHGALLQCPDLLQQGFLAMDQHLPYIRPAEGRRRGQKAPHVCKSGVIPVIRFHKSQNLDSKVLPDRMRE